MTTQPGDPSDHAITRPQLRAEDEPRPLPSGPKFPSIGCKKGWLWRVSTGFSLKPVSFFLSVINLSLPECPVPFLFLRACLTLCFRFHSLLRFYLKFVSYKKQRVGSWFCIQSDSLFILIGIFGQITFDVTVALVMVRSISLLFVF